MTIHREWMLIYKNISVRCNDYLYTYKYIVPVVICKEQSIANNELISNDKLQSVMNNNALKILSKCFCRFIEQVNCLREISAIGQC